MKHLFFITLTTLIFMTVSLQAQKQTKVLIQTDLGDIKVVLYNETPLHRDNFIKLAMDQFYDSSIFHRVISAFMVQGGGAGKGKQEVNYRIPAEISPKFFHKKGALAAARVADQVNPRRESSGSQFYIVQGKVMTHEELDRLAAQMGVITPEQRLAYTTIGGTPFLDQQYTVFGEVVEGLDVVDKIAAIETSAGNNKPVKDIFLKVKIIEK